MLTTFPKTLRAIAGWLTSPAAEVVETIAYSTTRSVYGDPTTLEVTCVSVRCVRTVFEWSLEAEDEETVARVVASRLNAIAATLAPSPPGPGAAWYESAPEWRCTGCGRKTTSGAAAKEHCGMLQPDGSRCPGIFRGTAVASRGV